MKKYLSFLLVFMFLFVILSEEVLANITNSNEIITGEYQYSAIEGNNKQNQNTFLYKDSDFTKSSYLGSKSLEVLSIQVAASSLSWYGEELDQYEIDVTQNDFNIKNLLGKLKFNNIESNKYFNNEKKENSVGVIIGNKTIIQDGKEYTLLAIIPRSAGYKQEWVGNFTIGDGDIHEGFKSARDEILRFTKQYVSKNNISGDIKVWTVGYSRGAAISNMVCGFFAGGGIDYFGDTLRITPEDVYCYTIGTPSSIKDGASKNIELSVSSNREGNDYVNDTVGEAYSYTKGGVVSTSDSIYNGIKNIISYDDAFALLPPEDWKFRRYGKIVSSYDELYSIDEMLKELKSISEYVYSAYTTDGKVNKFIPKTFDLKSLSVIDKESDISQIDFFKERLSGLINKIGSNKIYNDEYQDAIKGLIGTYGMAATFINDISSNNNIETSEMIYPLIYTYLAFISDEYQSNLNINSENKAITLFIEDLLTYFTNEKINNETFIIDDFVKIIMKYLSNNKDEVIFDTVVSGIISIVPDDYKGLLSSILGNFVTDSNATNEEALKAFILACYNGPDPNSVAGSIYSTPEDVRQLLYMTMAISIGSDMPEIQALLADEYGKLNGPGKFEDFVDLMLTKLKQEKDDEGKVIKTYSNMAELADKSLVDLLDNLLSNVINKSEELYGKEYKEDFQKQFDNVKLNITKVREFISYLFFNTKDGYDIGKSIDNTLTLINNAMLIAMPHFDEIYLALARTSNRYDDDYDCIKGDNQTIEDDDNLTLTFSFDYYLFNENGDIYIDNNKVSKDNYLLSKGSTIVTINSSYLKTLGDGIHKVIAKIDNKEAEANFTITNKETTNNEEENNTKEDDEETKIDEPTNTNEEEKTNTNEEEATNTNEEEIIEQPTNNENEVINNTNNPQTGDDIMTYVLILGIGIIGLVGVIIYVIKKKKSE